MLRSYQKSAIQFILANENNDHGTLIPLTPEFLTQFEFSLQFAGLGKTKIALGIIAIAQAGSKSIVIAPVSTLNEVWKKQALEIFESHEFVMYHGTSKPSLAELCDKQLIITSLETLHSEFESNFDISPLFRLKFKYLVLDEAHVIRNGIRFSRNDNIIEVPGRSQTLFKFKDQCCKTAICLTGTPLMNDIQDLVPMVRLIAPKQAPSTALNIPRKYRWWNLENYNDCAQAPFMTKEDKQTWLNKLNEPFMFKLTRQEDIAAQPKLPECIEIKCEVLMSESQVEASTKWIEKIRRLCRSKLAEGAEGEDVEDRLGPDDIMTQIFTALLRLRQIANCTILPDIYAVENYQVDVNAVVNLHSTKYKKLIEDLQVDLQNGVRRIVISTFWVENLELLAQLLTAYLPREVKLLKYHGQLSEKECSAALATFTTRGQEDCQIFLVTLTKVAVGIDLSIASHLKIVDPFYNTALELQLRKRLHRPGQTQQVHVAKYISKSPKPNQVSVDEFIFNLQMYKLRNVMDMISVGGEVKGPVSPEIQAWDGKSRPSFNLICKTFLSKEERRRRPMLKRTLDASEFPLRKLHKSNCI